MSALGEKTTPGDVARRGPPVRAPRVAATNAIADAYSLDDIRELARRRLPRGLFEFIDRGTEDEVAVRNNREAIERVKFRPRMLVDVSARTTETELFGHRQSMPLAIAPTGSGGLVWFQGELELARAAAATNIPFTLATRSMCSIETIAEQAGGVLWFQLYIWSDRALTYRVVERAASAGYQALIVTADTPVTPNREYNQRNGFSLPFKPSRRALLDIARHPRWLASVMGRYMVNGGMPRFANLPGDKTILQSLESASTRSENLTWDDVREIRRRWPRTLMVKGLQRVDDTMRAVDLGADAVIVSNHGGRNLDGSMASIELLPEIVDAVGNRAKVLMDGGIRRGSDAVKAIAMGAAAVLVGRPTLYGTAVAGQAGAVQVLELLRREMLTAMGMTGCPRVADLDRDIVRYPGQERIRAAKADGAPSVTTLPGGRGDR